MLGREKGDNIFMTLHIKEAFEGILSIFTEKIIGSIID